MHPRPLTTRERGVLTALLAVDFQGVELLRRQADEAQVLGGCGCGCPSINFFEGRNEGMTVVVNAGVKGRRPLMGSFSSRLRSPVPAKF